MTEKKINICRPGYNSSCALCCGSHNYNLSPEEINKLFKNRQLNSKKNNCTFSRPEKSLDDGIQCEYVGYSNSLGTEIGCLIYNDELSKTGSMAEFFSKTCKTFFCPASNILTGDEILFAAELMQDWFYYSLLINEISILKGLCREYKNPGNVPEERLDAVKEKLKIKLLSP